MDANGREPALSSESALTGNEPALGGERRITPPEDGLAEIVLRLEAAMAQFSHAFPGSAEWEMLRLAVKDLQDRYWAALIPALQEVVKALAHDVKQTEQTERAFSVLHRPPRKPDRTTILKGRQYGLRTTHHQIARREQRR